MARLTPHATTDPRQPRLIVIALLTAAVMIVDGYDLQVIGLLVPTLSRHWDVPVSEFGSVLAAAPLGLGIGAALLAPLGDRFGRRRLILTSFAVLIAAVTGSGLARNLTELAVLRLLTGIALGATLPNIAALLAEQVPARNRATWLTVTGAGIALGAIGSGVATPLVVEVFGWGAAFVFSGGVSAVIWLLLLFWLKEPSAAPGPSNKAADRDQGTLFMQVLRRPYLRPTLALWALFASNTLLLYMLGNWIPALLAARGWTMAEASGAIAWFGAGGLVGGLGIATLMDRWNPTKALLLAYGLAFSSLSLFSVVPAEHWIWNLLLGVVGSSISGVGVTISAVVASIYPSRMMASGIGFTVAVGRVGAVGGPALGAVMIGRGLSAETFLLALLLPVMLCMVCAIGLRLPGREVRGDPR